MTHTGALAVNYLRRSRLCVRAGEALIAAGDQADAVRESQETVELAVKALLELAGLSYPRAHDVARLLRDPLIQGTILEAGWVGEIERVSKTLRRDRELSFYGDEDVLPLEYYERADADSALEQLLRVLALVSEGFERHGTPVL